MGAILAECARGASKQNVEKTIRIYGFMRGNFGKDRLIGRMGPLGIEEFTRNPNRVLSRRCVTRGSAAPILKQGVERTPETDTFGFPPTLTRRWRRGTLSP